MRLVRSWPARGSATVFVDEEVVMVRCEVRLCGLGGDFERVLRCSVFEEAVKSVGLEIGKRAVC